MTSWRQLYYDDATALRRQVRPGQPHGLRGVGHLGARLRRDADRSCTRRSATSSSPTPCRRPSSAATLSSTRHLAQRRRSLRVDHGEADGHRPDHMGLPRPAVDGTHGRAGGPERDATGTKPSLTWNGREADGTRVPDGSYRITLWAADASGQPLERSFIVTVDTRRRPSPRRPARVPTPDGDGHDDTIVAGLDAPRAIHGTVRIFDAAGRCGGSGRSPATSRRSPPGTARDDAGKTARRPYTYRVDVRDRAGNLRIVDTTILLDRTHQVRAPGRTTRSTRGPGRRASLASRCVAAATRDRTIYSAGRDPRRIWSGQGARGRDRRPGPGTAGRAAAPIAKPGTYRIRRRRASIDTGRPVGPADREGRGPLSPVRPVHCRRMTSGAGRNRDVGRPADL